MNPFRVLLPFLVAAMCANPDRVALLADTQNFNYPGQQQIISHLAPRGNEWLIIAGDVVETDDCTITECVDQRWQTQLAMLGPLAHLKWHLAPGNHDYGMVRYGDPYVLPSPVAVDGWDRWAGPRFHAFQTRHACFFLVDDLLWDSEQETWLREAVAGCGKPWKILVKHRPLRNPWPEYPPALSAEPQPEVFERFGFDLIMAGHQHAFAAWMLGGTLNVTLPAACQARQPPYPVSGQAITPVAVPMTGFGELEICADALAWRVFREDGLLLIKGRLRK